MEELMSFSPEWLSLREPADNRARNKDVLAAVTRHFAAFERVNVVDLAGGTGSTFRSVVGALPVGQVWTLIDVDDHLLDTAKVMLAGEPVDVKKTDLRENLAAAFQPKPDLVVTSAFLDLVSGDWLDRLIEQLKTHRLPFYAALSYDGRASCDPPQSFDRTVIEAVNRHQKTDKGFGPALGPDAAAETSQRLKDAGFHVVEGRSDWLFLPSEGVVKSMIIDGWAQAVYELGDVDDDKLSDWASWHLTRIAEGQSEIMVGHVDLFAVPV
jgi:hypothetical protein